MCDCILECCINKLLSLFVVVEDAGASGPDGNLTDDPKPAVEETVEETACAKSTSAESEEKPVASEPAEKLACNSSTTTAEPNVVTSEEHRPDVSTALDKLVEDDEVISISVLGKFRLASFTASLLKCVPRTSSTVERIDLLHFLTGCHKSQLNQALSVLSLSLGFFLFFFSFFVSLFFFFN